MCPFAVLENGRTLAEHPALTLLARPNTRQSGSELLESIYAYLQTAGNAYLEAAVVDGEVKALYGLRPDRMSVVSGRDGWPVAYTYTAGGKTVRLSQEALPVPAVLHMALFHPLDDHYGMAPARCGADQPRYPQRSGELEQIAARQRGATFGSAGLFECGGAT